MDWQELLFAKRSHRPADATGSLPESWTLLLTGRRLSRDWEVRGGVFSFR
jgi:hypothetical protein